jgi:hypothetical protein
MGATGQGVSLARVCPTVGATPCGCPLFGQAQGPAPTSPVAPYNLNLCVKNFKSWNKTVMKTQINFAIIFIIPGSA